MQENAVGILNAGTESARRGLLSVDGSCLHALKSGNTLRIEGTDHSRSLASRAVRMLECNHSRSLSLLGQA